MVSERDVRTVRRHRPFGRLRASGRRINRQASAEAFPVVREDESLAICKSLSGGTREFRVYRPGGESCGKAQERWPSADVSQNQVTLNVVYLVTTFRIAVNRRWSATMQPSWSRRTVEATPSQQDGRLHGVPGIFR